MGKSLSPPPDFVKYRCFHRFYRVLSSFFVNSSGLRGSEERSPPIPETGFLQETRFLVEGEFL
ncbi:hypothetical protein OA58_10125 [Microcystis aeruginosa NIES-88]|nr:hypothetical protein OA58_10125 [Microcystis aeruginosa NIES-88]